MSIHNSMSLGGFISNTIRRCLCTRAEQHHRFNTSAMHSFTCSFSTVATTTREPSNSIATSDSAPTTTTKTTSTQRKFRKWQDPKSHREFFEQIVAPALSIRNPHEDWYRVTPKQICDLGGSTLLKRYHKNSFSRALIAAFPEIEWQPWRFSNGGNGSNVPRGFWKSMENRRRFFDWLEAPQQLDIRRREEDWYRITADQVEALHGKGLLRHYYAGSLVNALQDIYPDVRWEPWRFARVPQGFWEDRTNHRRFFDWIKARLQVRQVPEDWYSVSADQVRQLGGEVLLIQYYGCSIMHALEAIYPEIEWEPWRFESCRTPSKQQQQLDHHLLESDTNATTIINSDNQSMQQQQQQATTHRKEERAPVASVTNKARRYFDKLAKRLQVQHLDDWYRISNADMDHFKGSRYVVQRRYGGLCAALKRAYPHHAWDEERFHLTRSKRAAQRRLVLTLKALYPNEEILEEYNVMN